MGKGESVYPINRDLCRCKKPTQSFQSGNTLKWKGFIQDLNQELVMGGHRGLVDSALTRKPGDMRFESHRLPPIFEAGSHQFGLHLEEMESRE